MAGSLFIAVDLGAGSGRVFLAGVDRGEFLLEEIHRFQYPPIEKDGNLRWDLSHIFAEIRSGLKAAGERARSLGREIKSLGIDSWAVDYGLLDASGNLIADPVCYRDDRTKDAMEQVFARVPRSEIFEKTGIQFQNFNTLYQLFSEKRRGEAADLLLLPDLLNYFLTDKKAAEYTNATTTQFLNASTGNWDHDLIKRLELPSGILPQIVPAGTDLGPLKPETAEELGLEGVHVVAPATHDTGSAVAGAPLDVNSAYISSGTWSLIGVELEKALISEDVAKQNFTNEGGVYGTVRFLKNVMGLWLLESCRREWKAAGLDVEYDTLLAEVAAEKEFKAFIFPDDPRFLNPPSMLEAITQQLAETGQQLDNRPAAISKVIFDSLAFRYASVLRSIETLTGKRVSSIQILGGGGRNTYLNQMTANASRLPVEAGLTEATVVGNVLVQAITAKRFSSIAEAREHVAANFDLKSFEPQPSPQIEKAGERYAAIEDRYTAESISL
ncbi:MAG: rhamnulokinase [Acidobacteria bacterium]|nr:rhamnulokinase [Acidobacteriota bacterium]